MASSLATLMDVIETDEAAAACNCPSKFGLVDAGGVLFGAYFMADGVRRIRAGNEPVWGAVEAILGALAATIHGRRFLQAQRTRWLAMGGR